MTLFKEAKKEKVEVTVERLKSKVYVVIAKKGDITKEAILVMPKKNQMDEFEYRIQMVAMEINKKGIEVSEQQVHWRSSKRMLRSCIFICLRKKHNNTQKRLSNFNLFCSYRKSLLEKEILYVHESYY